MAIATDFKFGEHIYYIEYYPQNAKLGQRGVI